MDWRMENNILKGIGDIVSTSQKQHAEEIKLLNQQHQEVIQELLKQSQTEQQTTQRRWKKQKSKSNMLVGGFMLLFLPW